MYGEASNFKIERLDPQNFMKLKVSSNICIYYRNREIKIIYLSFTIIIELFTLFP